MTVLDGDSDFRRCLKPSALFRYVEQVSADHARAYGMDHAFFRERRSAFLVGKQALRVWRMPGRAEKINLTTACEAFKKGTMKRLTTITSETGEKLALVDCRWIIVDTEAGRILRTPGWTMPDFQNDDLPEELPQIVHKSQPLTAAGAPATPCVTSTAISTTPSIWTSPATLCRRRSWRLRRCPSLPSSTTVKCRWARPCRCSMPPQETAGMCWAGGKSTRLLSVIWNSEALSQNLYKNNYKEITKNYCKSPSKELQYGYRKGKTLLDHEIFFFLFFGISGVRHPPPAVLLRSCRPTPHRRYSASCAKEPVWFRTGFFASKNPEKSTHSEGKYDLRSICLFFCKGHL